MKEIHLDKKEYIARYENSTRIFKLLLILFHTIFFLQFIFYDIGPQLLTVN